MKNVFTFKWSLIDGIMCTGVISFDGCVLSLLTDAHALCLLVPTNQVRQNITPTLCTVLNMQTWRYKLNLSVIFIRLSTGPVYPVILFSGARWTLHWDGWCFEPPWENRRWCVEAQICFYIPFKAVACKKKCSKWNTLSYALFSLSIFMSPLVFLCLLYSRLDDGWKTPWWWKGLVP